MTRRHDRLVLVAAAVVTVAWAAWRLPVAPRVVPTALIVGAVAVTGLSVPVALVIAAAGRRVPATLRHRERGLTAAHVGVLAGWVVTEQFYPSFAGFVALMGSLAALVSLLYVLPLAVGALVADGRGVGFRSVALAWPPSLVAGVLVFLAPAPGGVDLTRYNATFLEGPAFVAVMGLAVGVVVLGPAATAALVSWRTRR